MSAKYKAAFLSAEGFDPTLPSGKKELSMPVDWIAGTFDSRHLYQLTRARRDEWWYRFRRFAIPLSITGENTLNFNFNCTRRMLLGGVITDEHDLRKPGMGFLHEATHASLVDGAITYFGEQTITNFDGNPANTATIDCTINMFLKRWGAISPFSILNYPMHAVSGDLWIPYFHLAANINVIANAEYAITIESTGSLGNYLGSFCLSHGGGDLELSVHSDGPDLFQPDTLGMDITPNLWFGWNGTWDTATGARL